MKASRSGVACIRLRTRSASDRASVMDIGPFSRVSGAYPSGIRPGLHPHSCVQAIVKWAPSCAATTVACLPSCVAHDIIGAGSHAKGWPLSCTRPSAMACDTRSTDVAGNAATSARKRPWNAGSMNRKRFLATYAVWYQAGENPTPVELEPLRREHQQLGQFARQPQSRHVLPRQPRPRSLKRACGSRRESQCT